MGRGWGIAPLWATRKATRDALRHPVAPSWVACPCPSGHAFGHACGHALAPRVMPAPALWSCLALPLAPCGVAPRSCLRSCLRSPSDMGSGLGCPLCLPLAPLRPSVGSLTPAPACPLCGVALWSPLPPAFGVGSLSCPSRPRFAPTPSLGRSAPFRPPAPL